MTARRPDRFLTKEGELDELGDHIANWLKAYLEAAGFTFYVLGVSGGLDSAVVAALATRAVGAERLRLIHLPYGDEAGEALEAARELALGITGAPPRIQGIKPAVDHLAAGIGITAKDHPVAMGNLKARVRAAVLRTEANRGGLLLGTGNLSETLLGYVTRGGDDQADVEPIGELFKTEVQALGRRLDLPEAIVKRPPSAELWPGQTDAKELGFTYEEADPVLLAHMHERDPDGSARAPEVLARVARTSYKRSPIPTVTPNPGEKP